MSDRLVQTVTHPARTEAEARVYLDYVQHYEIDLATDVVANVWRSPLPAGESVLEVRAYVKTPSNGTAPTMKVGDSADDDGFILAADFDPSAAAGTLKRSSVLTGAYRHGKQYAASSLLVVTFGGTAVPTTGVIVLEVVRSGYPSASPRYLIANR